MEKNITFYKTLVYNHFHHYWPFMGRYFYIWVTICLVAQSCPTLCHPMDCSPPGTSVHGILQARTLEWVSMPFSKESSQSRDQTWVSHIAGRLFTVWATKEAPWALEFKKNSSDCESGLCFASLPMLYIFNIWEADWFPVSFICDTENLFSRNYSFP